MKALILAAGYATRLYPLTKDIPKPLLKIGEKAIVDHILDKIEQIEDINEVYVVTNNKFYPNFVKWAENKQTLKKLKIINDRTLNNEDRLGTIGDIHFVLERESVNEDLLIIAGDNLFGFSLQHFINFFQEKKSSIVAFHDLNDLEKVKGRFGVGILNGSRVIDFEEKPLDPKSALASTACYVLTARDLEKVKVCLEQGKWDAPGDFIKHLANESELHGFIFKEHWFDVGNFESLKEAEEAYNEN